MSLVEDFIVCVFSSPEMGGEREEAQRAKESD